jgi:hypothetical protein
LGDNGKGGYERRHNRRRSLASHRQRFLVIPAVLLSAGCILPGQTQAVNPAAPLPAAPLPVIKHANSKSGACVVVPKSASAGKTMSATGAGFIAAVAGWPAVQGGSANSSHLPDAPDPVATRELPPCPVPALINFYERFINGPEVKPLTPREKARLAARNLLDPFNAVTIAGNAGITIGANSHTVYGPGMPGFARLVGVSYAEDMTNEFVGTFAISSIFHQDPHYHRMPDASIKRRILHAVVQVGWTQGDNGKGMPNYSSLLGAPIEAEIANLYVPGDRTNLPSTAARVVTGWALAPTDNFVSEFLPDIARHIHVRVIFVQQIINQVARTEPASSP